MPIVAQTCNSVKLSNFISERLSKILTFSVTTADQKRPKSRKPCGAARERFYLLEVFKDGMIDGQCVTLNAGKREAVTSGYGQRLETLHSHYLKALRRDRTLVHLGEVK